MVVPLPASVITLCGLCQAKGREKPVDLVLPAPDDLCTICFTSGTTGISGLSGELRLSRFLVLQAILKVPVCRT